MSSAEDANRESGTILSWDPTWFGLPVDEWGPELERAICQFQADWGIVETGLCADETLRRVVLDRLADEQCFDVFDAPESGVAPDPPPIEHIVVAGKHCKINWPKVVTFEEDDRYKITKGYSTKQRKGRGCVIHWPVTYTPLGTVRVLNKRGYGTHFEIGPPIGASGDVTIYQYADVAHHTWHAVGGNSLVGIDVSSPVYWKDKVLKKLERLGHSPRPKITGVRVNGWRTPAIIGYHENQLQAFYALLGALKKHADIELAAPAYTGDPMTIKTLKSRSQIKDGVFHHAEVDTSRRGKWDTAGLDLRLAVTEAEKNIPSE
jgi:hypothetical protein